MSIGATILPHELMPSNHDPESTEVLFTFTQAQRQNFVDQPESKWSKEELDRAKKAEEEKRNGQQQLTKPSSPPSAASPPAASPVGASRPARPSSLGLFDINLSAPSPSSKTIPPPRNHILTRQPFATMGANDTDLAAERPEPSCGFSMTLIEERAGVAKVVLIGGANDDTLIDAVWTLHVPSRRWSRSPSSAGGPGRIFGHTGVLGSDGRIWVFGGLCFSTTFVFTSPTSATSASTSSRNAAQSPTSNANALDPEMEDEIARRRLVQAKLQAKLADLSVEKPPSQASIVPLGLVASNPASANTSPKLVDAAGSPGGGVGHELEDADSSIEVVGFSEAEAAEKKKKGGFAWRMMTSTGKGLLKVAKSPWKAAKMTGKGLKTVGKVLYPSKLVSAVYGPSAPKSKAELYGVENEENGIEPVDANGNLKNVPVKLASQMSPDSSASSSAGSSYARQPSSMAGPAVAGTRTSNGGAYIRAARHRDRSDMNDPTSFDDDMCDDGIDFHQGQTPSSTTYCFDTRSDSWVLNIDVFGGLTPPPRYMHAGCMVGEKECFYIFGGCKSRDYQDATNDTWKCTIATNSNEIKWTPIRMPGGSKVPSPRYGSSMTYVGRGYILLFGGAVDYSSGTTKRMNDSWIFDTNCERWFPLTTYGSPPSPRVFHTAVLHEERFLHICAGEGGSKSQRMDLAILDLNTLAWSRPLADSTFSLEMHGSVPLDAGKVLNFGGLCLKEGLQSECFLTNVVEVIGQCDTYTQLQCKIVIMGSKGSGVTSLIRRFVEDRFLETSTPLGVDHRTVLTLLQGKLVKIHLYDVPSNATLVQMNAIIRDADAAVLVYDPSHPLSLDNLGTLATQVAGQDGFESMPISPTVVHTPSSSSSSSINSPSSTAETLSPHTPAMSPSSSASKVHLTVVSSKCDLPKHLQAIPQSNGRTLASSLDAKFAQVSSRDSTGIDELFLDLAKSIVKDRLEGKHATKNGCVIC